MILLFCENEAEADDDPTGDTAWHSPAIDHGCTAGDPKLLDCLAAEALTPSSVQKYLKDLTQIGGPLNMSFSPFNTYIYFLNAYQYV